MALDAQLSLPGERKEGGELRTVRIVARHTVDLPLRSGIDHAGPHGMRQRDVLLVARATDLKRIFREEDRPVRGVGGMANRAAALLHLGGMRGLGTGKFLLNLLMAPEARFALALTQQTLVLGSMGRMAREALSGGDRRMHQLLSKTPSFIRVTGITQLCTLEERGGGIRGRDLMTAGTSPLHERLMRNGLDHPLPIRPVRAMAAHARRFTDGKGLMHSGDLWLGYLVAVLAQLGRRLDQEISFGGRMRLVALQAVPRFKRHVLHLA